jgi:hypothetical protein
MIDPDTNRERALIVEQLKEANLVERLENLKLGRPYQLVNRAFRGYLKTDGKMRIFHLTHPSK